MAITGTCGVCGRAYTVGDDAAGRKARCPACKETFVVPPSRDLPGVHLLVPAIAPGSPREEQPAPASRPFWKDPVVVVGAAVPTFILVAFLVYLMSERSA